MNRDEIIALRQRLGLTQAGLAAALRMGKQGMRRVREWENGEPYTDTAGVTSPRRPSGPAQVALELIAWHGPESFREYLAKRDR